MPEIGEIKKGGEIGKVARDNYIWVICPDCGKPRWVRMNANKQLRNERCKLCAYKKSRDDGKTKVGLRGDRSSGWKGGRRKDVHGYILIWLSGDDFFYSMAHKDGCVREHRLVMAKHLGRCLHPWEIVHHKNGIKDDNRLENLQLISELGHKTLTLLMIKMDKQNEQIRELKQMIADQTKQIKLLRWQLKGEKVIR